MRTEYIKTALIPAYEPDEKLIKVLEDVKKYRFDIFVVDDGSGEKYKDIFEKAAEYAEVISYPENKGKGYALKTGIKRIKEKYKDERYVVVTLDSDGQHTAEDTLKICEQAVCEPATLVLGSRKRDKNVPLKSRFGNAMTKVVYKLSTGLTVNDTQTGLRAFTCELTEYILDVKGDRYEYEMNVLLDFSKKSIKITEVVIATIYYDNNKGTHFDPIKDSFRIYKQILKFSASSLISFCVDFAFYTLFCFLLSDKGGTGVIIANVAARVISASVNFTINRKYVFKSDKSMIKSITEYLLLALIVLAGNTLLLQLLVNAAGMNKYLAKIIVEITLFVFSFYAQRLLVFKKSKKRGGAK